MSNNTDTAFPVPTANSDTGLTKREYFAAMVLANCASQGTDGMRPQHYEYTAKFCVAMADFLIKELEQDNGL